MILVVEPGLVAVEQGERGVRAGEFLEGQGHPAALLDSFPVVDEALALPFHFEAEEIRFDAGVAGDAPMRRGQLADEICFGLVGGGEMIKILIELGLVFFLGLVGQNDGFRGQAMLDGVERDGAAAVLGFWTVRFGSVNAGGFSSGRGHKCVPGGSVTGEIYRGEARGGEVIEGEEYRGG